MNYAKEAEALIAKATAPSTQKAYAVAYKKWEAFAEEHGYPVFPASTEHVVWYLAYLGVQEASLGTAQAAVAAIADKHARGVRDLPCAHPSGPLSGVPSWASNAARVSGKCSKRLH